MQGQVQGQRVGVSSSAVGSSKKLRKAWAEEGWASTVLQLEVLIRWPESSPAGPVGSPVCCPCASAWVHGPWRVSSLRRTGKCRAVQRGHVTYYYY